MTDNEIIKALERVSDVEPVKRGGWIRNGWNDYSCSCCNSQYIGHSASTWNFCPYCGAKMERDYNCD